MTPIDIAEWLRALGCEQYAKPSAAKLDALGAPAH
jgi:hypothetical protein